MYINNFSSGTILALLALSGMLFLVPLAAPVHATNANPVQLKVTSGNPLIGTGAQTISVQITNPSTNAYAITAFALTAPTGWTVSGCTANALHYFENCVSSSTGATYYTNLSTGNTPLSPGASDTVTITVAPAAGFYPITGLFTSTVQDASSASFYTGPSFSAQVVASLTAIHVVSVTPTDTTYIAGSAPYTIVVEVTCPVNADCPSGYETGVPINFLAEVPHTNDATVTPSSAVSGSTGTATVTLQPSDSTTYPTTILTAVLGTDQSFNTTLTTITTLAGPPSKLTFLPTGTQYINSAADIAGTAYANLGYGSLTYSVTDQFGNAIPDSGFTISTGSLAATAGFFAGTSSRTTYAINSTDYGFVPQYSQSAIYGTLGVISGTITGIYTANSASFSVSGASPDLYTSLFSGTTLSEITPAGLATNATAGSTTPVAVQLSDTVGALTVHQQGVPILLQVCDQGTGGICAGTTKSYIGTFGGSSTFSGVTNSTGIVTAAFKVDTKAGTMAIFNATVSAPITGAPKTVFVVVLPWNVTTIAGAASQFNVKVGYGTSLTPAAYYATPGQTLYVNVIQSDAYGNLVNTGANQQTQITLTPSAGFLTATNIYIPTGCYETNGTNTAANPTATPPTPVTPNGCNVGYSGFGPIAWTLPSTTGPVTITASGVLNGKQITSAPYTVKVVSASPTISVTSPTPVNGFIYTNSTAVVFSGQANVSLGFPSTAHIKTIGYKIGNNSWQTASVAQLFNSTWSVALTLPVGLSTITFNATDSNSPANTVVSQTYSVLVDTATPTIAWTTPAGATVNGTTPLTATIVDSEGDLNATSVSLDYNGTMLPASDITVTGTNSPGNNVTYIVTANLPGGHWTVQITASNLAGTSGSSPAITVFQQLTPTSSFVLVGSVVKATVGGNPDGLTGSYLNNLPGVQTVTVIGTATNAAGQQVAAATATITINSLGQQVFSLSFLGLTPGQTYTITIYAVSSAGVAGSVPTTTTLTA
jgi:hypothetical protein